MKKFIILIALFIFAIGNSGCSAVHAVWPDVEDTSVVRTGAFQKTIEDEFGKPVSSRRVGNRLVNTYEYEIEPSGDPTPGMRVAQYLFLDLLTLLIMEPIFWYEEYKWEANYRVDIAFDSEGRVVGIGKPKCYGDCEERSWTGMMYGGIGYTRVWYWQP